MLSLHIIFFTTTLQDTYHYYSRFMGEETETDRSNLPSNHAGNAVIARATDPGSLPPIPAAPNPRAAPGRHTSVLLPKCTPPPLPIGVRRVSFRH